MDDASAPPAAERLELAIDRSGEVPVGVQLAWTLRAQIAGGRFGPGAQLPTLRELARASGVNVNTARAVYQRLDHEGLTETQHGSGTFVARSPARASGVRALAAEAAAQARESGVDPRDVAAALYVSEHLASEQTDPALARRRDVRRQIAALERALGEMEADHPGLMPPTAAKRPGNGPALLSDDELRRVRTQLLRRLTATQRAIDRLTRAQETARPTTRKGRAGAGTEQPRSQPSSSPKSPRAPKRDRASTAKRAPRRVRPATAES